MIIICVWIVFGRKVVTAFDGRWYIVILETRITFGILC